MGPSMSPCFKPIIHNSVCVVESISNLMLKLQCNTFSKEISFLGTPNFSNINHKNCRGTLSKALTRSRNNIHVSWLCSLRFFIASLTENTASMQPQFWRKPHCDSWSSCSTMGCNLLWIRTAKILYAASRSIIPL